MYNKIKNNFSNYLFLVAFLLMSLITILIVGWLLWLCNYGLDFTDEGFYLAWGTDPFNYKVSITQFGFIYHPLYKLLGSDIVHLRQFNVLFTFLLAWVLASIYIKSLFVIRLESYLFYLAIASAFASSSLIFFKTWLPTPNYNSLTLQALFISLIGFFLAEKNIHQKSIWGWMLIGFGGWLLFMAKITTAAALGSALLIALVASGKFNWRMLTVAVSTVFFLIVCSALVMDGSISAFVNRILEGSNSSALLSGGHTLANAFRFDDFQFGIRAKYIIFGSTAAILCICCCLNLKNHALNFIGISCVVVIALFDMAVMFSIRKTLLNGGNFEALLIFSLPIATFIIALVLHRAIGFVKVTRYQWVVVILFLWLPHIYAFGTNNNYWSSASHAGFFWVIAVIAFLSPIAKSQRLELLLLPLAYAAQCFTILFIQTGIETPYRQPNSLISNNISIDIGESKSSLILSSDFARYIKEAVTHSRAYGFAAGTPMIDLSGQSPGLLFALDAKSIGQAWTIGGYPGSNELASFMLRKVSCGDLSMSWVLTEPEGARKISNDLLLTFGANIETDFETVATIKTAVGAGDDKSIRVQQILKPVRSTNIAVESCELTRKRGKESL